MASIIRVKRSTGTGAPSSLNFGELGLTVGVGTHGNRGGRLFAGDNSSNAQIVGGRYYTDLLSIAPGLVDGQQNPTTAANGTMPTVTVWATIRTLLSTMGAKRLIRTVMATATTPTVLELICSQTTRTSGSTTTVMALETTEMPSRPMERNGLMQTTTASATTRPDSTVTNS